MTLVNACALVALIGMIAYAILGGADFGAGIWDLFARGPRRDVVLLNAAAALVVADPAHGRGQSRCDLPGSDSIRSSATSASASVSGSTTIRLTTVPATRFSIAQTKWGRSMRFIVEQ